MHRVAATSRRTVLQGLAAGLGYALWPSGARAEIGISDTEIVLGTMGALTGPLASNGIAMRDGTAAMLNVVNDSGGIQNRKLRLMAEDNAYSAPQALAAVRRMMSNGGIFTLINGHATPQLAAVLPYMIEQQKVPVFAGYGGLIEWYDPPRPALFGLYPFGEDQGRALGRWAGRDGARKVLVLHIDGNVYQRFGQAVESGLHNVSEGWHGRDAGDQVRHLRLRARRDQDCPDQTGRRGVHAVGVRDGAAHQGDEGAKSGDPDLRMGAVVTESLIRTGGANVEGLKATSSTVAPDSDGPAVKEYRADLARYFPDQKPEFFSLFSYGCTKIFVEALRRMDGPPSHEALYQALYTMKGYDSGILTPVTFSPEQHQGTRGLFQATITDGKWHVGGLIDGAPIATGPVTLTDRLRPVARHDLAVSTLPALVLAGIGERLDLRPAGPGARHHLPVHGHRELRHRPCRRAGPVRHGQRPWPGRGAARARPGRDAVVLGGRADRRRRRAAGHPPGVRPAATSPSSRWSSPSASAS